MDVGRRLRMHGDDVGAGLREGLDLALGVLDQSNRELSRFITTGVDDRTRAAIGALPRGRATG